MDSLVFMHEPAREYVYPSGRNSLVLKIKCTKKSRNAWEVVYWDRFFEDKVNRAALKHLTRDNDFDCFICEITQEKPVRYLKYYFAASGDNGTAYFGPYGQSESPPVHYYEYSYTNECDVFSVPEWAQGAVAYQIFPERFCNGDNSNDPRETLQWDAKPTRTNFFGGDLKGIIDKLDHISSLGAGILYLNPIFKSPSNHKYDTQNYYDIDPSFGTIEDLKVLTAQCHKRNIRVILDGVFNHCGYMFEPFQDVLKNGGLSEYKDWFYIDEFPVVTDPPNYECVGYYKWMPKIRLSGRRARDYFLDVGVYWIKEADIDGWRLDVSDEADFTFWQEFRRAVKSAKQDALLIGETWKDGRDLLRGDQMDSVMNYLFRNAAAEFFALGEIDAFELDSRTHKMLSVYPVTVYPVLYNLIGSHDTERFLTLCKGDKKKLKLAAAFQMTFPGMPAIYYGDETGMDGDNDPDCRRTMNWDNADNEMLGFYRKITALRNAEPCLKKGDFSTVLCDGGCYAYARRLGEETVYVAFNNSGVESNIDLPLFERSDCKLKSLLHESTYTAADIADACKFYNRDVNEYRSEFRLVLPAHQLDIIKSWRNE